ncbi:MAG: c-type cytochrome [bacterium]|nr:c-type cytochrome [bacterium]
MLSKSQARIFFLGATAFFSLIFLLLTIDTLRQAPERTNEDALTPEVVHGKEIFDQNNCMGCHTILGEGAYYAPELTQVYDRRGPKWIEIFLKDPEAMFPGQRRMVQYDFEPEQIQALIAFFQWIGRIDTNGFPPPPDMAAPTVETMPTPTTSQTAALESAPEIFKQVCIACHSVAGSGGNVGPALDGVANRFTEPDLHTWLENPQAVKPGTAMPNLGLPDETRTEIVGWLMTLR